MDTKVCEIRGIVTMEFLIKHKWSLLVSILIFFLSAWTFEPSKTGAISLALISLLLGFSIVEGVRWLCRRIRGSGS